MAASTTFLSGSALAQKAAPAPASRGNLQVNVPPGQIKSGARDVEPPPLADEHRTAPTLPGEFAPRPRPGRVGGDRGWLLLARIDRSGASSYQ